ncbi:DUF1904 family protein [Alkalihalophilus pseudofirmus]|uniref:DUF1904 family protein n=1 Tax=Alkalihalophilus pseudofirmus TaxID=79885 RepID=UPI001EE470B2
MMPFLRFKGIDSDIVRHAAPYLIDQMSLIANLPKETVKIEVISVVQITDTPSSVEIFMFERDQETHDHLASMINKKLTDYGYTNVHVFFVILNPDLYYKEGKPLKEIPRNVETTFM